MTEMQGAMRLLASEFPTAIQRVNHPTHQGEANPVHGMYYFVGRIPGACYDVEKKRSRFYASEEAAIKAAQAAGAARIQRADCSFVK